MDAALSAPTQMTRTAIDSALLLRNIAAEPVPIHVQQGFRHEKIRFIDSP